MEPLKIETLTDQTAFFDMIQHSSHVQQKKHYHIGAYKVDGQWKWKSDFTDLMSSMKWAPDEPTNNIDDNCLSVWVSNITTKTGFNDMRCETNASRFFCQKSLI